MRHFPLFEHSEAQELTEIAGIAELGSMLKEARQKLELEGARVVVTLNGDFLWRSELDRQDKG